MFQADLHCHSTASDGTLSPSEVILAAKIKNLAAVALVDHDTVAGIDAAYQQAKSVQIHFISGVELSTSYKGKSVHVLAYGFNHQSEIFQEFLEKMQLYRNERNAQIIALLEQHQILISPSLFLDHPNSLGRVHIANDMVEKKYVKTFQEAFYKWIGDRACCYVPGKKPTIDECIRIVHQAGGKLFLAHPHLMDLSLAQKILKEFAWDGIEAYYGRFGNDMQLPWVNLAKKKHLLISGGSDFHGAVKPESYLGSSFIDETCYQALLQNTFWQTLS
jgi:predicted metal-dependent phosphoesterase TrpH